MIKVMEVTDSPISEVLMDMRQSWAQSAGLLMLVGKLAAYLMTGSAAIMADASESIVHLAATGFAAYSLWYSLRPADDCHPYGHGRISFFSAGFEGALVFVASFAVIGSGLYELQQGPDCEAIGVGLAITCVLAVINLALGVTLVTVGRQHNSIVLVANGKHVLTDVYTTAAAIVGLVLVLATGQRNPRSAGGDRHWVLDHGRRFLAAAIGRGRADGSDARRFEAGNWMPPSSNANRGSIIRDIHRNASAADQRRDLAGDARPGGGWHSRHGGSRGRHPIRTGFRPGHVRPPLAHQLAYRTGGTPARSSRGT